MRIEYLSVERFRNYQQVKLSFSKSPVILVGENAQGKTNLLESIYYLATGAPFRANRDRELIKWDNDNFKIQARVISRSERPVIIEVSYVNLKKTIKINGIRKNTLQELLGNLNVVLFTPEDLKMVKGAPGERRSFLNREISQVSSQYYYFLSQYNKILFQRNTALKQYQKGRNKHLRELLNIWDNQLIYYGARIVKARLEFVKDLASYTREKHNLMTGSLEELELSYQTNLCEPGADDSLDQITNQFFRRLKESSEEELVKGLTVTGPQRDDLLLLTNGKETKSFGSQGQQRSAVLSIKLALLSLVKEKTGSYPVLLLDDVLSELDEKRGNFLLELIGNQIQTFITTTGLNAINLKFMAEAHIYEVEKGTITPKENLADASSKEES